LKYGHTANICYYRSDNYQPHESLVLYDPTTQQPVQFNSPQSNNRTTNTWVNPNLKSSKQSANASSAIPGAMLANTSFQRAANSTWILDSGASYHGTGEPQNIDQLSHFDGQDQITLVTAKVCTFKGSGSFLFLSPINSNISFKLNNLLHVPSITKNLLSVSQFAKDNSIFFEFHPHSCLVKSQGTNEILLQGVVGADGLYSFPNLKLQDPSVLVSSSAESTSDSAVHSSSSSPMFNSNSTSSASKPIPDVHTVSDVPLAPSSSTMWHTRLGHPNSHVLNLIIVKLFHSIKVFLISVLLVVWENHIVYPPLFQNLFTLPLRTNLH